MSGVIYGDGPVAAAVRQTSGLGAVSDPGKVTDGPVVLALGEAETADPVLRGLLEHGIDVISTAHTELSDNELRDICIRGGATYHHVGLVEFLLGRNVPTALQSLRTIRSIRVVERRDLPAVPADELDRLAARREVVVRRAAADAYGVDVGDVSVESTRTAHQAEVVAAIGGRTVYRLVSHFDDSTDTEGFFPTPSGAVSFAVEADSDPTDYLWQTDLPNEAVIPGALAGLVVDALPFVAAAGPGVVVEDPAPQYQLDARVARITT